MTDTTLYTSPGTTNRGGLFANYTAPDFTRDELLRPDAQSGPEWQRFCASLSSVDAATFKRRWLQARRTLSDQGVSYREEGEGGDGTDHRWRLDAVPLVMGATEWEQVSRSLAQRARLLNYILTDIYGSQTLLMRGLIPVDLVYRSPSYLRPCVGLAVPRNQHLHLYAADLGRCANGTWCVLADRTQAPDGAGYALENRTIIASMLNESFASCGVRRLASFFLQLRHSLRALSPRHRDEPEIVLLTPGPSSETYFEHVFLARYLGFKLVQGMDLMARDGYVYLKTLERPLPVDVILRRQSGSNCDPLELRHDSYIGIPGLVQAIRQGNVVVANALGSSWAETPALAEYLPAICREVYGEELQMPQVPSRWLGKEYALRDAIERVPHLVFKPTFRRPGVHPVFGMNLSNDERYAFIDRLRSEPASWVAQDLTPLSTAPNWHDQQMQPRPVGFRAFFTRADEDYVDMPGGLARVAGRLDGQILSMRSGGASKDIWIVGPDEPDPVSLMPAAGVDPELKRTGFVLSSRVADNMYWLGRYVERGEFLARILRWVYRRIESEQGTSVPDLQYLIRYLTSLEYLDEDVNLDNVESVEINLSEILCGDEPGSLRSILMTGRDIASRLRDRISMDAFRLTRQLGANMPTPEEVDSLRTADALETLNNTLNFTAAFSGIVNENMIRDPGWSFLDTGRRLERAFQSLTLLQSCLVPVIDADLDSVLTATLEIHDSAMAYRTRYLHAVRFGPALDLMLTDETNPRSVAFQLVALEAYARQLPVAPGAALRPEYQRLALSLLTDIRLTDPTKLNRRIVARGRRRELEKSLKHLRDGVTGLSDALVRRYFTFTVRDHQLG